MLGLYLHIPFCSSICNYCNFNRGLFEAGLKTRTSRRCGRRSARAGGPARPTRSSSAAGRRRCSSPAEIGAAHRRRAARRFDVAADAEITLETNPETSTREQAGTVSRGRCQSHQLRRAVVPDDELQRLGRIHSADRARAAVREARAAGFDNVSLDLMMWLPQQSVADWLRERRRADRRPSPITRRCICSSSIRTRR